MKFTRILIAFAALFVSAIATQIAGSQTAPAAITPASLAGDWEWAIGGPYKAVLHLRTAPGGGLTGTIDMIMTTSERKAISDIRVSGEKLTYKNSDGTTYEGTISADRKMIVGKPGSGAIVIWKLTKSAADASAADANEKPSPTDGTWTGVIRNMPYKGFPKPPEVVHVTVRLASNPTSCTMMSPDDTATRLPCTLTVTGNKVKIVQLDHISAFDGTLTPNLQMTGKWASTIPNGYFWGPADLTLTRVSASSR